MANIKVDGASIVTSEVRLSYVYLDNARKSDDTNDEKYTCMLMIPKSDAELVASIKQAMSNAVELGKQRGKGDVSKGRNPLKDGDTHTNMKGELLCEKAPEIKGHYIMNVSANTTNPPRLYVPNGDGKMRLANVGEIYSGCYARVYLNFYAYNNKSAGIGAGLRSVCKVRDGEVLGEAGMSDTDAFGAEVVANNTGDEFM